MMQAHDACFQQANFDLSYDCSNESHLAAVTCAVSLKVPWGAEVVCGCKQIGVSLRRGYMRILLGCALGSQER